MKCDENTSSVFERRWLHGTSTRSRRGRQGECNLSMASVHTASMALHKLSGPR